MFCDNIFSKPHKEYGDTRFDYNILGFCGECVQKVHAIWHGRHSGNYLQFNPPRLSKRRRKPISRQMALRVFAKSEYKCTLCGSRENLCVDHIIPFSKGGACSFENYQALCGDCNSKKQAS
jgi:hypothetical protein